MSPVLPPLLFVLGKGGVGRSTVAAALATRFAARGERTLIVQWAVADAISPWYGRPPAGHQAQEIAPRLSTMNYAPEETLREYFVEHLKLRLFYQVVVRNRQVRRMSRAAPGLEELLFLGRLFWLVGPMRDDLGWAWDRVVVDAPAMGHGVGLFAVPRAAEMLGLGGLLRDECARVGALVADPARAAALVVATAEELVVEETLELLPRLGAALGRPPRAAVINRSVARLGALPSRAECAWLAPLVAAVPPEARDGIARLYAALARRRAREDALADRLAALAPIAVDDALLVDAEPSPARVIAAAAAALAPLTDGGGG